MTRVRTRFMRKQKPNAGSAHGTSAVAGVSGSAGPAYFVDYVSGSDSNAGTSTGAPWKHAPGDDGATGNAIITLQPGDTVVFKGGVSYAGTATITDSIPHRRILYPNNSGTSGNPITFISGHVHSSNWGTGRAIIEGGMTADAESSKTGVYVQLRDYITIEGFEIQNVGKVADAAGVEFDRSDFGICRNCKIHDVGWHGLYVGSPSGRAYGIENNHSASNLYEKNEIYNCTDKLIEIYGGGADGSDDASNCIIRYNLLHDAAVHAIVLTCQSAQVYNNLIWNINNGTITDAPNPGYALKVDQGASNVIFNNIAYNVSTGWGVLNGRNNTFAHNVAFGVGLNGSGPHGSNDEAVINLMNNDNAWGAGGVSGNKFYNNIGYYIPNCDATDKPKFIFHNTDAGANNEIKNNILFALSGDTTSTANRVRSSNAANGSGGIDTYYSIASWESQFNTLFGGSGNVASGNMVVDPSFVGGILAAFTNFPTSFASGYTDVNTSAFDLNISSPAKTTGITVASPMNIDLRGNPRSAFWPGVYEN